MGNFSNDCWYEHFLPPINWLAPGTQENVIWAFWTLYILGDIGQYHVNFPTGKDFSVLMQEVGSSSLLKKVHFSEFLEKPANSVAYIATACGLSGAGAKSRGRLLEFRPLILVSHLCQYFKQTVSVFSSLKCYEGTASRISLPADPHLQLQVPHAPPNSSPEVTPQA